MDAVDGGPWWNILSNCGSVQEQKPFKRHSLSVIYFRFNYLSAKTTTTQLQPLSTTECAPGSCHSLHWEDIASATVQGMNRERE